MAVCAVVVTACYAWLDRPVAFYVHDRGWAKIEALKWLTEPPPMVQAWSPLVLVVLVVCRALRTWTPWQRTLFVSCLSLIVADQFRTSLGDVFGRYWPETWFENNPSLIGTGAYGFHPFVRGDDIGSFPSGHAARIVGFASVWWIARPQIRWFLVAICMPLLTSLVAMNYHFVGDVLAGGVLGGIVGAWAAALGNVKPAQSISSASPASPV